MFVVVHGVSTVTPGTGGYSFTFPVASYTPGSASFTMTLNGATQFEGILFRVFDASKIAVGGWIATTGYKTIPECANALTQTGSSLKGGAPVSFTWIPPATSKGTLTLNAFVLLSLDSYFQFAVSIPEATITVAPTTLAPITPAPEPNSPPITPTALSAGTVTNTTAVLQWVPSSSGAGPLTTYMVQYSLGVSGAYAWQANVTAPASVTTIGSLTANTTYRFRIAAVSIYGVSAWSSSVTVQTAQNRAPSVPQTMKFVPGLTSIAVSWDTVDAFGWSNLIFTLQSKILPIVIWKTVSVSNLTSFTLTGLALNSSVQFRVMASTLWGSSIWSPVSTNATIVPMAPNVPAAPTETAVLTNSLTINWVEPLLNGFPSSSVRYRLQVVIPTAASITPSAADLFVTVYEGNLTSFTLTGFAALITIQTRVLAITPGGVSAYSPVFTFQMPSSAVCPNACSGSFGGCNLITRLCECDSAHLGPDCSINVGFTFVLSTATNLIMSTKIVDNLIHFRVSGVTPNWLAIELGPSLLDGMDQGDTIFAYMLDASVPTTWTVQDMFIVGQGFPTLDAQNDLLYASVFRNKTTQALVFTWTRLLVTNDTFDKAISASDMTFSWAIGLSPGMSLHGTAADERGKMVINFYGGTSVTYSGDPSLLTLIAFAIPMGVVCLAAIVLSRFRTLRVRQWLWYARVRIPFDTSAFDAYLYDLFATLKGFTMGEVMVSISYFASMIAYLVYAKQEFDLVKRTYQFVLGDLSAIHMALAMLPVTRTSLWLAVFGISFERAIKWHRMWSRLFYLFLVLHGALELDKLSILDGGSIVPTKVMSDSVLYGYYSGILFAIMFVFTFEWIRRRYFELFYYTHFLFLAAIILSCYHSPLCWYLSVPALVLYVGDRVVRFFRSRMEVQVMGAALVEAGNDEKICVLEIYAPEFCWIPGDYVFLNVPSLSLTQWHPYTISGVSEKNPQWFTLHIRAAPDTFCARLFELVPTVLEPLLAEPRSIENTDRLKEFLYLDGPYGKLSIPLLSGDYEHIVLCAGGIGISPVMAVLQRLVSVYSGTLRLRSIHVIWSNSHEAPIIHWFPRILCFLKTVGTPFVLKLFVTSGKSGKSVGATKVSQSAIEMDNVDRERTLPVSYTHAGQVHQENLPYQLGRPNFSAMFAEINRLASAGASVGVMSCGPTQMLDSVREAAVTHGFHLHEETFLF